MGYKHEIKTKHPPPPKHKNWAEEQRQEREKMKAAPGQADRKSLSKMRHGKQNFEKATSTEDRNPVKLTPG